MRYHRVIGGRFLQQSLEEKKDSAVPCREGMSDHDLHRLARKSLNLILEVVKMQRGFVMIYDEGAFKIIAAYGINLDICHDDKSTKEPVVELAKKIFQQKSSFIKSDSLSYDMENFVRKNEYELNLVKQSSYVIIPLLSNDRVFGALYLDSKLGSALQSEDEIELLQQLGSIISVSLHHTHHSVDQDHILKSVKNIIDVKNRNLSIHKYSFKNFIGISEQKKELLKILHKTIDGNSPLLLSGESGVGKEMIAKMVHFNSHRKRKEFVAINCGAIPENLLENEFFGHVKGAFTGADDHKTGLLAKADNGTLFLDEIGELPLNMQVKLLRVLQEKEFYPVGGTVPIKTNFSVVSATNNNLEKMVKEGRFREDLFYRISVLNVRIPSVRERKKDIALLIDHALTSYATENGVTQKSVSAEAMGFFVTYPWPGNVREIINVMYNLCIFVNKPQIELADVIAQKGLLRKNVKLIGLLPDDELNRLTLKIDSHDLSLPEAKHEFEKLQIERALMLCNGKITGASHYLKMPRPQVSRLIKKYGLKKYT